MNGIRRMGSLLLVALIGAAMSGCFLWTTTEQGEQLTHRIEAVEGHVTQFDETREQMRGELETAKTRIAELEDVLRRGTELVTRTSADTGAQVEVLAQQIATQEGTIDELRHELERMQQELTEQQTDYEARMKKLARRAGVDMPLADTEVPAGADENFHAAQTAYEAREFSTARALYRAFIQRHHDDARADDAQYFIGQSYLLEDRPATALGELRHVVGDYATGDRVPYALLSMGDAFYRLHACTDATTSLQTLIRGFPHSPVIGDARTHLRDVQHAPTGYCQDAASTAAAHP
jgi:TolA-binding protein